MGMNSLFYTRCFLVGLSVASAVGPIFVLTFNRGAWYGFWRGFLTAFGAACGDCLLFLLGLLGVLQLIGEYKGTILFIDLMGGCILIWMGIRSFTGHQRYVEDTLQSGASPLITAVKSFILTIINPLTILFFMFIGLQILPEDIVFLTRRQIIFSSFLVWAGSLTMLSVVAFISSRIGQAISEYRLKTISHVTGVVFFGIGIYFLGDFVVAACKLIRSI